MNYQRDSNGLSTNSHALARRDTDAVMPVILLDWRPVRKNTLRGYAKILLGRSLMIGDVAVNVASNGRAWAGLPSKPIVIEGRHAVDASGKPRWSAILEWASDTARNRFGDSVIQALLEAQPNALDDLP